VSQESPQWSGLIMNSEDAGPRPRKASQVDAAQVLAHPPGCGVLSRWSFLVGEGGLGGRASLLETRCQGRLDPHAHGHAPPEGYAPRGFLQIERGGHNAWVLEPPTAACPMVLALIAVQQVQGWSRLIVQGVGRQDDTTLLGDERLMGRARRGQGPLELVDHPRRGSAWPGAAPPAVATPRAEAAVGKRGGASTVRQGRERWLGLGFTGKAWVAERLQGVGVGLTLWAPVVVDRPLCLGTAGLRGEHHLAVPHAPRGGGPDVIAVACLPRSHRVAGRLLHGVWCLGQGRRDTGHPGGPCVSQLLAVRCTGESAVGHQGCRPVDGLAWLHVRGDALPTVPRLTGMATEGLHPHGNPRWVFPKHVPPHVGAVGPLSAAVASRDLHDLGVRRLTTVVAPIDMEAGAIEMGNGRRQPQAVSGRDRQEPVEVCHASRIARVPGASQRLLMARRGFEAGGDEARCGCVLKEPRHTIAWLVHKAQPIADHRVDSMAPRDTPRLWGWRRRAVEPLTNAEFVVHPGDKAEVVQECSPVPSGHSHLLARGDATDIPSLLK
jgi:hypothetical protein